MTLDEWTDYAPERKLLKENLHANLQAMTEHVLNDEEIEELLRLQLIMVRQFCEQQKTGWRE